ncbi:MAG TPA: type II toxin-antitoxin system HicA family toxin [Bdellovibrionota bacterium]|nr:type II toxin-antitoxin system HicA family toxin [Bdellovibrionota bacterium]
MKKKEIERKLKKFGWYLLRHGNNHDVWTNGQDQVEVPRHPEIHEQLARYAILRVAGRNPGPKRG